MDASSRAERDNGLSMRQRVLSALLKAKPTSRHALAKMLGVSKSTVGAVVSDLLHEGIVEEVGRGESSGGRRPILLSVREGAASVACVHVDDSGEISAFLRDAGGNRLSVVFDSCTQQGYLANAIVGLIRRCLPDDCSLRGAVLALPGILDTSDGTLLYAANLNWRDLPIGRELASKLNVPIAMENSAGVSALGEKIGRSEGWSSLVCVTIGSAVGAAAIVDDEFYRGMHGSVSEVGHMVVDVDSDVRCSCGRIGCLETFLGTAGVLSRFRSRHPSLATEWNITRENIHSVLVCKASEGDKVAERTVVEMANYAAVGVANIANMMGPEAIIVEGRIVDCDRFWEVLHERALNEMLPVPGGEISVVRSLLGGNAVRLGLREMARRMLERGPW